LPRKELLSFLFFLKRKKLLATSLHAVFFCFLPRESAIAVNPGPDVAELFPPGPGATPRPHPMSERNVSVVCPPAGADDSWLNNGAFW
jgi:hypothetical protein